MSNNTHTGSRSLLLPNNNRTNTTTTTTTTTASSPPGRLILRVTDIQGWPPTTHNNSRSSHHENAIIEVCLCFDNRELKTSFHLPTTTTTQTKLPEINDIVMACHDFYSDSKLTITVSIKGSNTNTTNTLTNTKKSITTTSKPNKNKRKETNEATRARFWWRMNYFSRRSNVMIGKLDTTLGRAIPPKLIKPSQQPPPQPTTTEPKGKMTQQLPLPISTTTTLPLPLTWENYYPRFIIPLTLPAFGSTTGTLTCYLFYIPMIGATANISNSGWCEVHRSSALGDARLTHMLLRSIITTSSSFTLLHSTKDPQFQNLNPLELAASRGHLDVTLELLQHVRLIRDLLPSEDLQKNCLHYAIEGGNVALTCALIDAVCSSWRSAASSSSSLLWNFSDFGINNINKNESISAVLDFRDEAFQSPLMLAVKHENPEMTKVVGNLIMNGANLINTDDNCETALISACRFRNLNSALALLHAPPIQTDDVLVGGEIYTSRAAPNWSNTLGERALDVACGAFECPELIRALLGFYAVPGLQRHDGCTCLHIAAKYGKIENVNALLEWYEEETNRMMLGVDRTGKRKEYRGTPIVLSQGLINRRNNDGKTASQLALENNFLILAEVLKKAEMKENSITDNTMLMNDEGIVALRDQPQYVYIEEMNNNNNNNTGDDE